MTRRPGVSAADILVVYQSRAPWHGLEPPGLREADVHQAAADLGLPPRRREFDPNDVDALVDTLIGIARRRRPMYAVELSPDGRLALVFDPTAGRDNRAATERWFWALVRDQGANERHAEARRARQAGATVPGTARRLGVDERTLQTWRAGVRRAGWDPDTLRTAAETADLGLAPKNVEMIVTLTAGLRVHLSCPAEWGADEYAGIRARIQERSAELVARAQGDPDLWLDDPEPWDS